MKLYHIILFFLLLPAYTYAAGDSVVYTHYDITNGLPSNNVYMCMQDHLGYMWFATDNGVVKYNGYEFKLFTTKDGLPNKDVYNLVEDKGGRIWVYSIAHDFGYIKDDKFHSLERINSRRSLYPTTISEQQDGTLRFRFYADMKDSTGICTVTDTSYSLSFYDIYVNGNYSVFQVAHDGVYVVQDNKLFKVNLDDRNRTELICENDNFRLAHKGYKYIPFGGRYLVITTAKTREVTFISLKDCHATTLNFEKISGDTSEYYYVLYDHEPLSVVTNRFVYNLDSNLKITEIDTLSLIPLNSQVSCRYKDADGNIWYTSTDDGVAVKKKDNQWARTVSLPKDAKMVSTGVDKFSYWWSNAEGVLYRFSAGQTVVKYPMDGKDLLLHVSNWDDTTLSLSFYKEVMLMDKRTGAIQSLFGNREKVMKGFVELKSDTRTSTAISKGGMLGHYHFFERFPGDKIFMLNSISMETMQLSKDSVIIERALLDRFVGIFYSRSSDKAFAYSSEKLVSYHTPTGRSEVVSAVIKNFPKAIVNIETDGKEKLYIQSDGAIHCFNMANNEFIELKLNLNLANVKCKVSGDNLVICGKFGIAVSKLATPGQLHYVFNDGSYNRATDIAVAGDMLIIKTDKGYRTASISFIVEQGIVFNRQHPLFTLIQRDSFFRKINSGDTIQLTAQGEQLSFDGINYHGARAIVYEYRFASVADAWKQSDGILLMSNLAPGQYHKLEVVVRDDNWKSDVYTIWVYKQPFWYQTTRWKIAFWVCGLLFFAGLVLTTIYFTRRYVKRINEKRQQLTDLELRAIHSQINPHFIFNTLSTALYFINRNEMEAAYQHVNKFSHLLRSYLKSSQERYIVLDEEIEMLKRYVELQQSRFVEKFEFVLTIDNKLPVNYIKIPSLLLQPLVENAINHGLFHKKTKGLLKIEFKEGASNDELICTIEDNGVGRAAAKAINMANEFKKESYGSKLTQGLVDIFEQYEQMNIDISYIDKQEPERGTIVKLVIKNIKYITAE